MPQELVSICIPAYKQPDFIKRLLDSVIIQTYTNIEIIISDDTPDESVKIIVSNYKARLNIKYFHNQPALKTPMNWNNAILKAKGDFFMLMHQDDWFHSDKAIEKYLQAFNTHLETDFVFCQNTAVDEKGKLYILQAIPALLNRLEQRPLHLLRANVIGPPSNTMLRRRVNVLYNEQLIWLVDVDYYVRVLQSEFKPYYIPEHLVNIGLHKDQTTVFCMNNTDVIIKENILFAEIIGKNVFRDIYIYDYYWRLIRNYHVTDINQLILTGVTKEHILPIFNHIISLQKITPSYFLKLGPISKILMFLSYITR